jgi:presenilin-like A22 family membrane protease
VFRYLVPWFSLLVGILLLLRGCAALLARESKLAPANPKGESELIERSAASHKSMGKTVVIVAALMTAILAVMVFLFSMEVIGLPAWLMYVVYGILIVGGAFFAQAVVVQLLRLFKSPVVRVLVIVYAIATPLAWWFWPNWLTLDLLAILLVLIGLQSYMQITLNFKAISVIAAGMFVYDVINVYFTGNMMKLAEAAVGTKAEPNEHPLPFMLLVPDRLALDAGRAAALGLGDILLPGVMIMIAAVLAYRHNRMQPLYGGLIGYAVGLIAIFGILVVAKQGQPALITLYPCVLAGILLGARRAGLVRELFGMRHAAVVEKPDEHDHGHEDPAPA